MAFRAVLPELVFMDIFVAVGAIIMFDIGKLLEFNSIGIFYFMTFFAIHILMLSKQLEFGFFVIEIWGWFEFRLVMARRTIPGQCILMVIIVARKAACSQAQVGMSFFLRNLVFDQHRIMTFFASKFPMLFD